MLFASGVHLFDEVVDDLDLVLVSDDPRVILDCLLRFTEESFVAAQKKVELVRLSICGNLLDKCDELPAWIRGGRHAWFIIRRILDQQLTSIVMSMVLSRSDDWGLVAAVEIAWLVIFVIIATVVLILLPKCHSWAEMISFVLLRLVVLFRFGSFFV